MKIRLTIIGLMIMLFSSCTKEKNCTCVHERDGVKRATSDQVTDKECSDLNSTTVVDDTTYTITCKEK